MFLRCRCELQCFVRHFANLPMSFQFHQVERNPIQNFTESSNHLANSFKLSIVARFVGPQLDKAWYHEYEYLFFT